MHCCKKCETASLNGLGLRLGTSSAPRKSLFKGVHSCPPGYREVTRKRGIGGKSNINCEKIPPPRVAPLPPPPPAPVIKTRVNVAPVMQQAFTPQFAPTMQQMSDSAGAAQGSAPTQSTTAPQAAEAGRNGLTAEEVAALIAAAAAPVAPPPPSAPVSYGAPVQPVGPGAPFIPDAAPAPAPQAPAVVAEAKTGLPFSPWLLLAAGVGLVVVTATNAKNNDGKRKPKRKR